MADGTVIAELQRGYRIRDRVLRPAMVVVSTGGPSDNEHQHQPITKPATFQLTPEESTSGTHHRY